MKKKYWFDVIITCFVFFMLAFIPQLRAEQGIGTLPPLVEIETNVRQWMEAGGIPGLTLVIIRADGPDFVKGYGYADLETKAPVTVDTWFELGSCSKSFTALAALQLEAKGLINLDAPVSDYLPWFYVGYNQRRYEITLRQCLHHSSGIPWKTLANILPGDSADELQQTVRSIVGIQLKNIPGKHFHYATLNYDIVGAVIEKVTGKSYEDYITDYVFTPLGLTDTWVGVENNIPLMATGYKRGYFQPRKFAPPVFRGNNPAAYIVSNGKDIAKWLKIQMGLVETQFNTLIKKTHQPDLTVQPGQYFTSYAMGWHVNPYKNNETYHSGLNPNFTSYICFRPNEKIGVAVLANSDSTFTQFIGGNVMKLLLGQEPELQQPSANSVDDFCSILSFVMGLYLLIVISFILIKIIGIFTGKSQYQPLSWKNIAKLFLVLLGNFPFLLGIYLIPQAIARLSWKTLLVWLAISFNIFIVLLLVAIGASYSQYALSLIYPSKSKYRKEFPQIAVISILSGLAGTAVLFLITTSFFSSVPIGYLLYYFGLVYLLNVGGKKIAQTKMLRISNHIALDLRIDLIHKLFTTRYQHFEKIHDGQIFTTLNDDTAALSNSAGLLISFFTSLITLISGFIYMVTISLLSTLVVIGVTIALILYYQLEAKKARVHWEAARDSQNVYMSLLYGTIRGYKELSTHRRKKYEFKQDVIDSSKINCHNSIMASINHLNAQLTGESIGLIVLGVLSIVISRIVSGANIFTLISFVMVLLYLLGPIRLILNLIPGFTRIKVSWDRIKNFVKELDIKGDQESVKEFIRKIDLYKQEETINIKEFHHLHENVENLKVKGLMFEYESQDEEKGFSTGPIDFELNKGEVLFLIGGNGSGKTTVAKLVTGLYLWDNGTIKINDMEVDASLMGEYFSTIYSNYHLFKKLYGVDINDKEKSIQEYLKVLDLDKKVQLKNGEYSTLDLSGGQRKRLALFQCFIENRPIFLFDEVAADQDPGFRRFFYRKLLPQMKKQGKLIIAITHDDHYFDVADKVIKLDMGKIDNTMKGKEYNLATVKMGNSARETVIDTKN